MGSRLGRLVGRILPYRKRWTTALITVLAALFMLSGTGSKIIDMHDTFGKTDRLAAISLIISGVPDTALPVTLLDVDDTTRQAWKAQGATPHAALAELVRVAAGGGARAILLDFDLTMEVPGTPGDPALENLIAAYPPEAPLLMLVRKIGFGRTDVEAGEAGIMAASASASPYDGAAAGKPNVLWVTTLNDIGADRSVRRLRLWQTVCDGAAGVAYPSPALATAARIVNGGAHAGDLDSFLAGRVAVECGKQALPRPAWPPVEDASAQLPYVFGNRVDSPAMLHLASGGSETVVLRRISAGRLVAHDEGRASLRGDIDRDPFDGRIAIIGASYTESTDIYETPLGTMPGSVILANSMVQAQTMAETVPASPMLRNVLALGVFLVFAVFVRYLVGIAALLAIGLFSVLCLVVLSRIFGFQSGVDTVAAAITGFALFKLIDALVLIAMDIPRRGWRVLLKS